MDQCPRGILSKFPCQDMDFQSIKKLICDSLFKTMGLSLKNMGYITEYIMEKNAAQTFLLFNGPCIEDNQTLVDHDIDDTVASLIIECPNVTWSQLDQTMNLFPKARYLFIMTENIETDNDISRSWLTMHVGQLDIFVLATVSRLGVDFLDLWSYLIDKESLHIYHSC